MNSRLNMLGADQKRDELLSDVCPTGGDVPEKWPVKRTLFAALNPTQ
jgi:hypothetical protein